MTPGQSVSVYNEAANKVHIFSTTHLLGFLGFHRVGNGTLFFESHLTSLPFKYWPKTSRLCHDTSDGNSLIMVSCAHQKLGSTVLDRYDNFIPDEQRLKCQLVCEPWEPKVSNFYDARRGDQA